MLLAFLYITSLDLKSKYHNSVLLSQTHVCIIFLMNLGVFI